MVWLAFMGEITGSALRLPPSLSSLLSAAAVAGAAAGAAGAYGDLGFVRSHVYCERTKVFLVEKF